MSPRMRTACCTGCGSVLEEGTRRFNRCPECIRSYYREWSKTPKAKAKTKRASERYRKTDHGRRRRKSATLKSAYGIDIDELENMMAAQKNECAICRKSFSEADVKPCVDHCHKTGEVRGILCFACNAALGWFRDDELALANAIAYLKQHQGNKSFQAAAA